MTVQITIDKAGRVVIPKRVRDSLRLEPGDALEIESTDSEIKLRPVLPTTPNLVRKRGIWVYRSGTKITNETVRDVLEQTRNERMDDFIK